MNEHIDEVARAVTERTSRRGALLGVSALALGALGILSESQETVAENKCSQCKNTCKRNNKKSGKKNPNNCSQKCRSTCNN